MALRAVPAVRLGFKANWHQLILLALINSFVGSMVGLERTVLPLIAGAEFGIAARTVTMSFLVSFGLAKALANLSAGRLADRLGRQRVLIAGWLAGLPVPPLIIFAPNWGWIVLANTLLGVNQGFCWSATVIMKMDLAGPRQRGLAIGLNEFSGYFAVSLSALATGYLAAAHGMRPAPFYPGVAFAIIGLMLSSFSAHETLTHARLEADLDPASPVLSARAAPSTVGAKKSTLAQVLLLTSWKDRALFAACQAGLVNNLNDGMMWGLVPIFLTAAGLPIERVGFIAAAYPGVWGIGQLLTGALSDSVGRKWQIASGMWIQAAGIGLFVLRPGSGLSVGGAVLLGLGTALAYPALLAAVSDVARPEWRASAVGVYRLWRDAGYAVGALISGLLADTIGIPAAIAAVGGLTFFSGVIVAAAMYETLPSRRAPGS